MRIGITTASFISPRNSIIIYQLLNNNINVSHVIVVRNSRMASLRKRIAYIRKNLLKQTTDAFLVKYAKKKKIKNWDYSIKKICRLKGIKLIIVRNLNDKNLINKIKDLKLDIIINGGGGIFRSDLINAPRKGIINAHMGCLPKYRGFNVLEWSLYYKDRIGVTLHMIDGGIDTGDILEFKEISPLTGDNIKSLRARASVIGIELMVDLIKKNQHKVIVSKKQSISEGQQYFAMHDHLKNIVDQQLSSY